MRAIVANLDCELAWAQAHSPGPHRALPQKVLTRVSELSLSASVLGEDRDRFITLSDLAEPRAYSDCEEVLVWGHTPSHRGRPTALNEDAPWKQRLWQLVCEPSIAAEVNDRRFCLGLNLPSGLQLPGMQTVSSLRELDTYLREAPLGSDDAWVAKAPWSASGRERLKRRGRVVEGEQRAFAARLLRRYGALLVEPWMNRLCDVGVAGLVGQARERSLVFPPHQLNCDSGGVFRGIRIDDVQTQDKLGAHCDDLMDCVHVVIDALHQHGYRGPFGVDSFLYEGETGESRLRAVCEINARITFGHVARALAEREGRLTGDFLLEC